MNEYSYKVYLCDGHSCSGYVTVSANTEEDAYEIAMDYVLSNLANALPELGIDVYLVLMD